MRCDRRQGEEGYLLVGLVFAVFLIMVALSIAAPASILKEFMALLFPTVPAPNTLPHRIGSSVLRNGESLPCDLVTRPRGWARGRLCV